MIKDCGLQVHHKSSLKRKNWGLLACSFPCPLGSQHQVDITISRLCLHRLRELHKDV